MRVWGRSLLGLLALVVASPGQSAPPDGRVAAMIAAADRVVRQRMAVTATPGVAVAIVHNGRVVLSRGYGHADVPRRRPVDPDRTLFRIGSVTKLFTYTLAMQQVEAGRLDLDRDLNAYLGAGTFPRRFGTPITARAVMGHRTGFEDAVMYRLLQPGGRMPTAEEFVHDHVPSQVRRAGSATSYSNFAVSSLGLAVSRIAGIPYPLLVERRIFAPLGMRHSAVAEAPVAGRRQPFGAMAQALSADMSVGYGQRHGAVRTVPYEHIYPAAAPAGSISASAGDMARFMAAYLNGGAIGSGRILQPATVTAMRRRLYDDRPGAPDFAGGFSNGAIGGRQTFSHDGAMNGFRSELLLIPDLDLGVFVVANSDAWDGTVDASTLIATAGFPPLPQARPVPIRIDPADYAGDYITSRRSYTKLEALLSLDGSIARVRGTGDGALTIAMAGGSRRWSAVTPTLFRDPAGDERIVFQRGDGSKFVRFYNPGGTRFFERLAWWQRPMALYFSLGLVAVVAVIVLVIAGRPRSRSGWLASSLGFAALLSPLAFVLARSSFDSADPETWPPGSMLALVIASYAECAVLAAALTGAAIGAMAARTRVALVLLAAALGWSLYLLSWWGVFGPIFN